MAAELAKRAPEADDVLGGREGPPVPWIGAADVDDPIAEVETAWPSSQRRFRAMGTDVHVLVVGPRPDRLVERAVDRIAELEGRWSRFLPTSEVSELNRRAGRAVPVSADTRVLVDRAILANRCTGGRFDATLGNDLIALGYDRPFDQVLAEPTVAAARTESASRPPHPIGTPPTAAPTGEPLAVDHKASTATVAAGLRFDPGGIGKGLAADLIVDELLAGGAWGALVNLGGDLRVGGIPPSGPNWVVAVDHPHRGPLTVVELVEGGLATSTTLRRRWPGRQEPLNHLLDPATRRPHHAGADFVTVIADRAWWAEASATALIGTPLDGPTAPPADPAGAVPSAPFPGTGATLLVEGDGAPRRGGPFTDFERPRP